MSIFTLVTKPQIRAETVPSISDNPAVFRCCNAMQVAYDAEFANSNSNSFTAYAGAQAYSDPISILVGYENIRDSIACTAQQVLTDANDERKSTRFLAAAQVAFALFARKSSPR